MSETQDPMTTTTEAVEAALRFADAGSQQTGAWLKVAYEFSGLCKGNENVDQAAVRILAARVRELEREREGLMKTTTHQRALDEAYEALREIVMLCGNPDPSDGEGTSPKEVVEMVKAIRPQPDQEKPGSQGTCERCGGQGWYPQFDGEGRESHQEQCESCYGTGQPEQAKQADEVLYGLEGQELLDDDVETIVSHVLHTNCEKPGESFDVVADRIQWPVKVLEFRRMKVSETAKNSLADSTLESVIEQLDEDHAGPDGTSNKPTAPMQLAARRFIDEVTRHYVVWNCEPTGEVVEITREKAKEIVG